VLFVIQPVSRTGRSIDIGCSDRVKSGLAESFGKSSRAGEKIKTDERVLRLPAGWGLGHRPGLNLSSCCALAYPRAVEGPYSRRLGNMTLLDPTMNNDIGNKPFEEKTTIYKTSPILITQEIAGFKKWGPDEIDERQAALADDALKIWTV
jgi:Protein of unknown function (DUF1524)